MSKDWKEQRDWVKLRDSIFDSIQEKGNWKRLIERADQLVEQNFHEIVDKAFKISEIHDWEKRFSTKDFNFAMDRLVEALTFLKMDYHVNQLVDEQFAEGVEAHDAKRDPKTLN